MADFMSFVEEHILQEVIVLIWILYGIKLYLTRRQRALMLRLAEPPACLDGIMSKEIYEKSRVYDLDKLRFSNINEIYSKIFHVFLLVTFTFRWFWEWSVETATYMGFTAEHEILISTICFFYTNVVFAVADMPLKVYEVFFLEEKHGFNKQKPLFFVKDQLLKFLVIQVITLPLPSVVIWIVKSFDYFFVYLWLFGVVLTLFLMVIYPEVIAPLFDKYSPLPDGELKKKIEALAASVEFPLYKLFIVEGSKRSSHSNAYLYGFHKHKRIVLFDTLVKEYYKPTDDSKEPQGCETDEVLAVLAHEIGHWKYSHTLKGFLLAQVSFIANIFVFAKLLDYAPIYTAFGFTDTRPTFIGLMIVGSYILIPFNTVMQLLSGIVARRLEFEADRFACTLGHGPALKRALIKLHKDNLTYPFYDRLYAAWHHSHPQLFERIEAIDKTA